MLSNYHITKILGQGGMGKVYLGTHKTIQRQVAIKELLTEHAQNPHLKERFRQEASLLATLDHPYIVRLHDYIETHDKLYLVMEYVEGISLEYLKQKNGRLSQQKINTFFPKILQAIAYAHHQHIIHRDLKPSNIILNENPPEKPYIKILDFGIAKALEDQENHLTRTGTRIGTIYYMSPEQIKGQNISPQSDIYALGVMLFELLVGYNPYENINSEYDISHKILHEPLPLLRKINPEISDVFQKMVFKATAKNPKQRYQNAEQWLEEWLVYADFLSQKQHQDQQPTLFDVIGKENEIFGQKENPQNRQNPQSSPDFFENNAQKENIFQKKAKNSIIDLVIYQNEDFEKVKNNANNNQPQPENLQKNIKHQEISLFENTNENVDKNAHEYLPENILQKPIIENISLPEKVLLENGFGTITNKRLHFYQHKDLFEQGILTEIDLIDIQKITLNTQREAGSGIFLWCVSMPFLWFLGNIFTILLFLLFFGVGLMCFLEFPFITLYLINGKKITMKGWFYEYKDARMFVKNLNKK